MIVIDAGGIAPAVWGELATNSAIQRGVAGVVIYGAARDTGDIRELGFPLFCTLVTPTAGEPKGFGEIGVPIRIDGVTIVAGRLDHRRRRRRVRDPQGESRGIHQPRHGRAREGEPPAPGDPAGSTLSQVGYLHPLGEAADRRPAEPTDRCNVDLPLDSAAFQAGMPPLVERRLRRLSPGCCDPSSPRTVVFARPGGRHGDLGAGIAAGARCRVMIVDPTLPEMLASRGCHAPGLERELGLGRAPALPHGLFRRPALLRRLSSLRRPVCRRQRDGPGASGPGWRVLITGVWQRHRSLLTSPLVHGAPAWRAGRPSVATPDNLDGVAHGSPRHQGDHVVPPEGCQLPLHRHPDESAAERQSLPSGGPSVTPALHPAQRLMLSISRTSAEPDGQRAMRHSPADGRRPARGLPPPRSRRSRSRPARASASTERTDRSRSTGALLAPRHRDSARPLQRSVEQPAPAPAPPRSDARCASSWPGRRPPARSGQRHDLHAHVEVAHHPS